MTTSSLIMMAKRASQNRSLIAYLIETTVDIEQLDWERLSEAKDFSTEQIAKLALCYRPRKTQWLNDMQEIASYLDVDINRIASFLNEMENLVELRAGGNNQLRMAARDRDQEN